MTLQVQVPEPPNELCGIWAYIKWEAAGCPNRSGEESDREYQRAIQVRHSCWRPESLSH